jgi:hypothetical protein
MIGADTPIDNTRYHTAEFTAQASATLHGIAGYFDTTLYKDIKLSMPLLLMAGKTKAAKPHRAAVALTEALLAIYFGPIPKHQPRISVFPSRH